MSAAEKHRDLSQLSALLAKHTQSPAATPAATRPKARALTPANDNKPARQQLAWPALERLASRRDYARVFALRHWRDVIFPQEIVIADDGADYEPESAIEIRPSEAELLGAVGWKVVDRERWGHTGEKMNVYTPAPEVQPKYSTDRNGALEARIGNLMFRDGDLKRWGETKKGAPLKPVERARGIKGGSNPTRTDGAIWSYIRLKGAVSPLAAEPYLKPISIEPALQNCYDPLPREEPSATDKHGRFGVREARQVLADLGVDGGVPFDALPFHATRCPVGLIGGDQWVGGVKQPKPTASHPAGHEPEFVRNVETMDYVARLRSKLGKHASVLDMAITDTSATDIGIAMGLARSYAEKRGALLIDAALDALIEIDDSARGKLIMPAAEEKIAA